MKAKIMPKILDGEREILQNVLPVDTPFLVSFCILNYCNLSCKFCYHSDTETKRKRGITPQIVSWDSFVKVIDDLKQFPRKLKVFRLSAWGEPLLHPDYVKMLKYVRDSQIAQRLEVFTNGISLTPELSNGLISGGLNKIIFSIEALSNQGYYDLCGKYVDFNNLVKNIKYLYQHKGSDLRIHVKIADIGLKKDEETLFYNIFGEICDEMFIEHIVPISVDKVSEQVLELTDENKKDLTILGEKLKDRKVCPFIFTTLNIGTNLKCQLCNKDLFAEMPAGDVNKQSLYDIWNGDPLQNIRKAHLQNGRHSVPFCRECTNILYTANDNIDDYADIILSRFSHDERR